MNKSQIRIFWNINPSRTHKTHVFPILEFIPDKGITIFMSSNKISKLSHIKTLLA